MLSLSGLEYDITAHLILSKQTPSAGQTVPGPNTDLCSDRVFWTHNPYLKGTHCSPDSKFISIVNNNKKCIDFKVFKKHFVSVLGVLSMPKT